MAWKSLTCRKAIETAEKLKEAAVCEFGIDRIRVIWPGSSPDST